MLQENMKKLKTWLVLSLCFNILIGVIGGVLVYRRGGLAYLSSRVAPPHMATMPRLNSLQDIYAAMPTRRGAIVFVGDSLIQRCPWNEILNRDDVLNRGIGGETIANVRGRLNEIARHQPRQIFLMIGINDLLEGRSGADVGRDLALLKNEIRKRLPQTQIVLQSLLPINAEGTAAVAPDEAQRQQKQINASIVALNNALRKWDDGRQIRFVDVHSRLLDQSGELSASYTSDGLHLNGRGYRIWQARVRPFLKLAMK